MKFRLLVLCLALPGCFNTDDGGGTGFVPTLMTLDPGEFMGNLACESGEGSVQRYVATFTDVTAADDAGTTAPFTLPISALVSCHQAVGTSLGVPGHQYVARVAAYDRTDIEPLAPGSPIMVVAAAGPEAGNVVAPRWVGECARPLHCVEFVTQYFRDCPLAPAP